MDGRTRPAKRRRTSVSSNATTVTHLSDHEANTIQEAPTRERSRSISPPDRKRGSNIGRESNSATASALMISSNVPQKAGDAPLHTGANGVSASLLSKVGNIQASPIHLSAVNGLPPSTNIDTVSLHDILGDPLIKECWAFNYLFDIEWMIKHFDEDVRDQIELHLVHGFWKRDDPRRANIEEAARNHSNIKSHSAYLSEPFGTHHTKMFILIKHDETAQLVILTANMLAQDWRMTQAVWRSPNLPILQAKAVDGSQSAYGSGARFKLDLLSYLRSYEWRLRPLIEQLVRYDFQAVKAALIASTPGRQNVGLAEPEMTLFGWPGLTRILRQVPTTSPNPSIAVQISSVGTLGVKDEWLRNTFFTALSRSKSIGPVNCSYSIIFPTAEEIRRSHTGYECGSSIHFKTQKPVNQKQLAYMRPMMCHWAGDCGPGTEDVETSTTSDAGRKRAGPHIKTYIRFSDSGKSRIDWAMVTSANLSKQAWGEARTGDGTVRVCSYEIGVVVWPELFAEGTSRMIPTFKSNMPTSESDEETIIGFRMPYDLPLVPYAKDEDPWCCTSADPTPDWQGRSWPGF